MVCFSVIQGDIISFTSLKITLVPVVVTYLFFAKRNFFYLNSSDLTKLGPAGLVSMPMKADISSLEQ